jgi:hypothetical protein
MNKSRLCLAGSIVALALCPAANPRSLTPVQARFTLTPIPLRIPHHDQAGAPHIRNRNGTSSNWGAYASETSLSSPAKGAANAVQGSWTIPTVTASTSAQTYSAFWVGIDGDSDSTVEQIGTEQDWTPSGQNNYVWFEMYPHWSYIINGFPISVGDKFSASVKYVGSGNFTLTIVNVTKNVSYTVPSSYTRSKTAQRSSAEWIVEAPYSGGVLPLANFGTAQFTDCTAALYSNTGPIDSSHWQDDYIIMETSSGTVKAQASGLTDSTSNGTTSSGFTVQWHHE